MIIKWNVDTGYCINIPDWELEIDDEEVEGMTEDEKDDFIDEVVQEAFHNNIGYYWNIDK